MLALGSAEEVAVIFGFEALRPNHFEGLVNELRKPPEGDVDRGKPNGAELLVGEAGS